MHDREALPEGDDLSKQINDSLKAACLVIVPRDILSEEQLRRRREINLKRIDQGDAD